MTVSSQTQFYIATSPSSFFSGCSLLYSFTYMNCWTFLDFFGTLTWMLLEGYFIPLTFMDGLVVFFFFQFFSQCKNGLERMGKTKWSAAFPISGYKGQDRITPAILSISKNTIPHVNTIELIFWKTMKKAVFGHISTFPFLFPFHIYCLHQA